ncbi:RNA polymerase sigma-70 factor [Chitinophaga sp. YIM B06452]|uniref:RNA polymerase sigma-70 factor n=1 Tax=Chitinophaga sp. YIM B06452 TaxID=3082158 RepID=UPI0031FF200D
MLFSLTDQELLEQVAHKSEAALTVLHYRYYALLCAAAFKRIQDEAVVEEIVQDVLINFWEKAPTLDRHGNVQAYLFATLRNKVLHEMRARMIMAKHAISLQEEQPGIFTHEAVEMLQAKELEQKLHIIIDDLSPQCKEAFTLSRFERLSYKSIAQRMNISVNTVEKHIGKALNILREKLGEHVV